MKTELHRILRLLPFIIVSLVVVYAVRWLFLPGFMPTHDGEYHIIRFHEFETMLKNGYIFPRWAPNLNSGYGVPLFNFFYPFPNYVGTFYHMMGLQLTDAFKLTLASGYIIAVFFCFLWLRKLFPLDASLFGTVVFAYFPYWFVDIFVRGSIGEVLAIAFVLVALYSIESEKGSFLSLSIGLMILSHNILTMIFLPFLLCYSLVRCRNKKISITRIGIGIGLATYFWLPALSERGYVTGLNTVNFRDHFPLLAQLLVPSWGTGLSGAGYDLTEMSYQIGLVPLLVMLIGIYFIFNEIHLIRKKLLIIAYILLGIIFYLMLSVSSFFWKVFALLQLLQYPWRLLSLVLPLTALISSYIATKLRNYITISIAVIAILLTIQYTRPVTYEPRLDSYYLSRINFTDGTSSLGNGFSTIWSPWKDRRPLKKLENLSGDMNVKIIREKPLEYLYQASADSEGLVRLNVLYYPGWNVYIDGILTPIDFTRDGTITFLIPKGSHMLKVVWQETFIRKIADFISVICFVYLIGSGILRISYAYRNRHITTVK